jgi:hypothetical protein
MVGWMMNWEEFGRKRTWFNARNMRLMPAETEKNPQGPHSEWLRGRPVISRIHIYQLTANLTYSVLVDFLEAKSVTWTLTLDQMSNDMNPVPPPHTHTYYSHKIRFNIIISYTYGCPKNICSLGFSTKITCTFLIYLTCPTHPAPRPSPWSDQQNYCVSSCPTYLEPINYIIVCILILLQVITLGTLFSDTRCFTVFHKNERCMFPTINGTKLLLLMYVFNIGFLAHSQTCEAQLSVRRPHATTQRLLYEFSWNFTFDDFRQSIQKIQVSLKSDKNNGYFTWRPMYIHDNISFSCS